MQLGDEHVPASEGAEERAVRVHHHRAEGVREPVGDEQTLVIEGRVAEGNAYRRARSRLLERTDRPFHVA